MRDAAEALRSVGLSIDVRRTLGSLPLAVQQLVAIARATARAPRVLILDEPTSRLGEVETRRLFELLRRLRQRGMGLIFITHFLDQAYQLADRVTVLRNGARVGAWRLDELPRSALVGHMLGAALAGVQGTAAGAAAAHGVPVLEARGLQRRGSLGPTDLRLFEGETVGVVGLLGSGRTRLARLLFGLDRASGGTLWRRGRRVRLRHPRQAMRLGLGMLPENRRTQGVLPHLSLRENVALALQVRRGWLRPLSRRRQRELAHRFIQVLGIDTRDAETPVRLLSGGNQQKALLARWLAIDPAVLILDEPTRGIDVGAQSQVQRIIGELRRRGMAILLIDSALEELVRGSDRVVVMRDRRAVAELSGAGLNEESLMHAIAEGAAAAGSGPAAPTRR
jgi:simple sugar transport system ATP-binding protein